MTFEAEKNIGESKSREDQLENIYNHRRYDQIFPFQTESTNERISNFLNSYNPEKPILVNTGRMAIVSPEREIMSDGFSGCAGFFMRGKSGNLLIHMVSGNDYRNFGYWKDIGGDPVPQTVSDIFEASQLIGGSEKVVIIANKTRDGELHLNRLKEELESEGIENIDIATFDLDNSLIYFSPESPESILVLGYNKKDKRKEKYSVAINS
ncbi:hypothetical protein KKC32_04695 [Patescibacteria group bacterium]|nr:hypothetical protein [Patescibacteria group bacterium]